jgi:hypothetical protein
MRDSTLFKNLDKLVFFAARSAASAADLASSLIFCLR